jgi:NAD(P)-dependent dehydrogenase (short-subunit alcohol dehydrogenase family)
MRSIFIPDELIFAMVVFPASSGVTGTSALPHGPASTRTPTDLQRLRRKQGEMNSSEAVALVTGGNRGLGLSFVKELQARGARVVYAGVRNVSSTDLVDAKPIRLDVTEQVSIDTAAEDCSDVTLLINNAGIGEVTAGALDPNFIDAAKRMNDTNFYGIVRTSQAFAPVITRNGGGAIINVLSNVTWYTQNFNAGYSASKSAAWSYSNSLRIALRDQAIQVLSLHVGFMDTDMARGINIAKSDPRTIAAVTLDALESGSEEILADQASRDAKHGLLSEPAYYLNPPGVGLTVEPRE